MTDDDAFLRAIQSAPNDAAPKLVYADWLDENRQPLRAEYLRLMTETLSPGKPGDVASRRYQRLQELWRLVGSTWRDIIRGSLTISWNAETLLLLGRLTGLVQACASFKSDGYLDYQYEVRLLPKLGRVEELVAYELQFQGTLQPLQNDGPSVRATLHHWLTHAVAEANPNRWVPGVSITHVIQLLNELLPPLQTWEVPGYTSAGAYDGACLVFEGAHRVLMLCFEVGS